jgi:integrase
MSARPFTEPEYLTLSQHFASAHRTRDRLLLILGCATGYRIQELLSLTVGQVWDGADVVREITVARKDLKGGRGKNTYGLSKAAGCPFPRQCGVPCWTT